MSGATTFTPSEEAARVRAWKDATAELYEIKEVKPGVGATSSQLHNANPEQDAQGCCAYLTSLLSSFFKCISDFFSSLFACFRSSPIEKPATASAKTDVAAVAQPATASVVQKKPLALQQIDQAVEDLKRGINAYCKLIFVARVTFLSEKEPQVFCSVSQTFPPYRYGEDNPREHVLNTFVEDIYAAAQGKQITDFTFSRIGIQKKDGPYTADSISVCNYFFGAEKVLSDGGTLIVVSHSPQSDAFDHFMKHAPRFDDERRFMGDEDERARENQAHQKKLDVHVRSSMAWRFLQDKVKETAFAID